MENALFFNHHPVSLHTAMTNSILIHNCTLLAEADAPLQHNAWLLTRGDSILAMGGAETPPPCHLTEPVTMIDAKCGLLMPGLINAHNHCAMTLFRGLADDMDVLTWLTRHIFPAEAEHVKEEMVYHCSQLAAAEMIRSGTTTVADGYFLEGQAAQAFADAGLRAVAAHGIIDFPAPGVADPARNIETAARFLSDWENRHPLITPAIFAHSPYTCSTQTLQKAKELANQHQTLFFIHVAESPMEQTLIKDPQGDSPIRHLAALDLLDRNTICIHCVWVDDEDQELLARHQAGVVICPQSHLKLASGMAPASAMLGRNIRVGLGTDGCASNNSLDMFREMDLFCKTQKLDTLDATALPARQALRCVTAGNADLLGLTSAGRLAPGCKADCILLDMRQPHLTPCYNQDLLVYGASGADVTTVIIDGRLVMHEKELLSLDLSFTMAEVHRLANTVRIGRK